MSIYSALTDELLVHLLIGHEKRALEDTYLFVYHLQIIYPQCEFNWPGNPRSSLKGPPPLHIPIYPHFLTQTWQSVSRLYPAPLAGKTRAGCGSDRQPERAQPGQRGTHWRGQAHVKWGVEAS